MKNRFKIIVFLLIGLTIEVNAQSKYRIGGVRIDNYVSEYDTDRTFGRAEKVLRDESLNTEKGRNYSGFSNVLKRDYNSFSIDFLIRKRDRTKKTWLHHEFSVGLEKGKMVTNSFLFYNEKYKSDFSIDNPDYWYFDLLLGSTDYAYISTSYVYESDYLALRTKEMVWILNVSYFSIGVGVRVSLGFKYNSKITKVKNYGVRSSSLFGSSSYSTKVIKSTYNDKNGMTGTISIPVEFSLRFSKNKKSIWYYSKAVFSVDSGVKKSIFSEKEDKTSFLGGGIGLQIGF